MHRGYIKLWRKFFAENKYWKEKRVYSRAEAWIDMVQMAFYKDSEELWNGNTVLIKCGSFITSERILAKRWGWSTTKVRRFLGCLERVKKLSRNSSAEKSTITLAKYEVYNCTESTESSTEKAEKKQRKSTKEDSKESKEINTSIKDYDWLVEKYGEEKAKEYIQRVRTYAKQNHKKYGNEIAVAASWIEKDLHPHKCPHCKQPCLPKDVVCKFCEGKIK